MNTKRVEVSKDGVNWQPFLLREAQDRPPQPTAVLPAGHRWEWQAGAWRPVEDVRDLGLS